MSVSKHTGIGNEAENGVMDILNSFEKVDKVWRDLNGSKFDIYFIIKGENVIRGLQVKALTRNKNKNSFKMNHLDKYDNGMLIVGINKDEEIGLAYIKECKHHMLTATITKGGKKGVFSLLLMEWKPFIENLAILIHSAIIVTQEVFEKSIYKDSLLSFNSIERFTIFCKKWGHSCEEVNDTSSATDLIFNGMRAQMKFSSSPENRNGTYSYKIVLSRTNKKPYNIGDNSVYIIELGTHPGDFLFLPEKLLIERGYIQTDTQKGKVNLNVYPHDYIKVKEEQSNGEKIGMFKGNWTCDKSLWLSTKTGRLS